MYFAQKFSYNIADEISDDFTDFNDEVSSAIEVNEAGGMKA